MAGAGDHVAPRFGALRDGSAPPAPGAESFSTLMASSAARVERIVSLGAASPDGHWYDQDSDEFVLLVQGEAVLGFEGGGERRMRAGDWAVLPAHCRHRVAWTAPERETIWLAVHLPPASSGVPGL